jgi:hypothetical protein
MILVRIDYPCLRVGRHSYRAPIRVSGFYRDYKTRWCISGSPTSSFLIVVLKVYYAHAMPC